MNQKADQIRTAGISKVEVLVEPVPVKIMKTKSDGELKFQSYAHILYLAKPQDGASLRDSYLRSYQ
ncbi:MAG: hypothetical protein AABX85_02745 [Nanoarchaeota archaeon]